MPYIMHALIVYVCVEFGGVGHQIHEVYEKLTWFGRKFTVDYLVLL